MPALVFPQNNVGLLQDLASRLIDSRKARSEHDALARNLLAGFHDACMRTGLDGLLVELEQANPLLDISDSSAFSDHPRLLQSLVGRLRTIDLDGGGPRNAKPGLLVDSLLTALAVSISDLPVQMTALDDRVRSAVVAALASVADAELALPRLRETIIATGRELCEPQYHRAFDLVAEQLDERGMRMNKQPKIPIDALHAVQRVLFTARTAVIDRLVRAAIDRAKAEIEPANAELAARIDLPVTHRLTPRDIASLRACDARVPKQPAAIVACVFGALVELLGIAWRAPERSVRPYAANQTFAIGDLLEHPKFGRGSVVSSLANRIEVEFADGKHTLVHLRPAK